MDSLTSCQDELLAEAHRDKDNMEAAFFLCSICDQSKQGYSLIHNRCYFSDKQMVCIQETPIKVPGRETPVSIVIFTYNDLVDVVRPLD